MIRLTIRKTTIILKKSIKFFSNFRLEYWFKAVGNNVVTNKPSMNCTEGVEKVEHIFYKFNIFQISYIIALKPLVAQQYSHLQRTV